jgi:hypothetical protein
MELNICGFIFFVGWQDFLKLFLGRALQIMECEATKSSCITIKQGI